MRFYIICILFLIFGLKLKASEDSLKINFPKWRVYLAYDYIGAGDVHFFHEDFMEGASGFQSFYQDNLTAKFIKLGLDKKFKNYLSLGVGFSFGHINVFDGMGKVYWDNIGWRDQYMYKNKLMMYLTLSNNFHPLKLLNKEKLKWDFYFTQRLIVFPYAKINDIDLDRNYISNPRLAYHFGSGISYDFKPKWGFFGEVYYLTTKTHTPEIPFNFGLQYKF